MIVHYSSLSTAVQTLPVISAMLKTSLLRATEISSRPMPRLASDRLEVWKWAMWIGFATGRDHNSYALCMWMAGGDIRGGATAGETDEFSLRSVGEPIHIRDVHATILDLMGLEDGRLTYLHGGRRRRLTDIGGKVVRQIIGQA